MRVTIDLPDEFSFSTEIPVLGLHLSPANHLDNALLLSLISEARGRFLKSLGYTEWDMEGVAAIVANACVAYRSEAFQGETMIVDSACRDFHNKGFDIVWRIRDRDTDREVARGKTGVICFDANARKAVEIPEKLRQRLQS